MIMVASSSRALSLAWRGLVCSSNTVGTSAGVAARPTYFCPRQTAFVSPANRSERRFNFLPLTKILCGSRQTLTFFLVVRGERIRCLCQRRRCCRENISQHDEHAHTTRCVAVPRDHS